MSTKFQSPRDAWIKDLAADSRLRESSRQRIEATAPHRYSYLFAWMGQPIIQFPEDLVALPDIIFRTRPDVLVDTGVTHGGSRTFVASMLELLGNHGFAVGVEIDLCPKNLAALQAHPRWKRMRLVSGSSTDGRILAQVHALNGQARRVRVVLDSNHTRVHVACAPELYAPTGSQGCCLCVMDAIVEQMPEDMLLDRPCGPGDNPAAAQAEFSATDDTS